MTSSQDALYRAICADPDEDTPRLAYADLVEEDGDTARAAFIRKQVALARTAEYDSLHVSTRQLDPDAFLGHAMAHTLPRLPAGFDWDSFEFRRGFPWKAAVMSADAFREGGEAVFAAAPIQALVVDAGTGMDFGQLADWPHLDRIHRLEFELGRVGADAGRFGDSPHAAALTELAFEFGGITAPGLESLARSALFPRLSSLELRSNAIAPELLVDALAAARESGALARLGLVATGLTAADADHLFALPAARGLQHLDLSANPRLGVRGAGALAESGVLRGLRKLKLEKTLPGVTGLKALTEGGGLAGLRSLDLSNNRLGPVAIKLVAESAAARGLRVLNLSGNPITDSGAAALAKSKSFSGLLDLGLADTRLTDAGAIALAGSPYLEELLRLDLTSRTAQHQFGSKARRALTERFGRRVSV